MVKLPDREKLRKWAEAAKAEPVAWEWAWADDPFYWNLQRSEPGGDKYVKRALVYRDAAMSPDTTLALLAYIAELEAAVEEALNDGKDAGADFVFEVLSGAIGATGWYTQDGSETWEGDVSATLYHILYKGGVLDPETNQRALLPKASVREEQG